MRLYFAGPLFTQAERLWNRAIADALIASGHDVFLPQEEIKSLDSLEAGAIFRLDVDGVRSADAIVAILDGADADSGTSFECGIAFALGIPIVAVRTDFRGGGDALPGQKVATLNLMLSEAASGFVVSGDPGKTPEWVVASILEILSKIPGQIAPIARSGP